ncbi:MBL fold metallo-hydrolase [Cohnella thailandensis]|uniref:MBL fold metallo-hydrolase n=1 Tax=Cohnella thailandensis TaxID=557557 RepID=A0A841SY70_9BACL|nr:MBL fold metallo-hydrolase [Cohnella thailandensis]MBB6635556.1 MBL fold metallo-hydrolase [Cohnella thailandensis]MBP1974936.1 glyoxylase-like metal-dependent hydrolase (beta-lactamase superfamily II) [Cohnella thailandensis]
MHSCHPLPIEVTNYGEKQVITPVLLSNGHERILVDCGYPGFIPQLRQALLKEGFELESITHIIATHHDMDHIGSLAALKRMLPGATLIAHEIEAPYLDGSRKSQRLEQAESTLHLLPQEAITGAKQFMELLASIEPASVDQKVRHGDILPWCGGIEIIHTPGHMAGHISLYLRDSQTLIAGDAVVVEDGELDIANPQYALDLEEAVASVRRLMSYEIETLICYHGGRFQGDIRGALDKLVKRY